MYLQCVVVVGGVTEPHNSMIGPLSSLEAGLRDSVHANDAGCCFDCQ